ncbi:hypothetical protein [Pseudomonas putida]|uniref:hypothetical protein n=1 Tax=Pseudomonas putida TaxID=303 RepID=UPI00235BFFEE|nr:hypothetical protein [Pseudomonas putida]GLO23523.1 hypothetical protein PPUJ21368_13500 [Pseudomonas putida]HDS0969514.1 hypothetical protein [Pseudomonas putida]
MIKQDQFFDDLELTRELEARERYLTKRTRARQVSLFVSLLGIGLFYFSAKRTPDYFLGVIPFPEPLANLIALGFLFSTVGLFTYFYIQGEPFIANYKGLGYDASESEREELNVRVQFLEEQSASLRDQLKGMGSRNIQELVSETVEAVKRKAYDEVWNELISISSESAEVDRTLAPIQKAYENVRSRLLKEVESLGRRGTVNLVCGGLTTFAALAILLSLALDSVNKETYQFLYHDNGIDGVALALLLIPKLSLATFVQVFSLFFLRLYRSGLSEIKYFQNELTNVDVKYLGLISAVVSGDDEAVNDASKKLLEVERNHVLNKGQSTVELEKHKIEQRSSAEIIKLLPSILGKK